MPLHTLRWLQALFVAIDMMPLAVSAIYCYCQTPPLCRRRAIFAATPLRLRFRHDSIISLPCRYDAITPRHERHALSYALRLLRSAFADYSPISRHDIAATRCQSHFIRYCIMHAICLIFDAVIADADRFTLLRAYYALRQRLLCHMPALIIMLSAMLFF